MTAMACRAHLLCMSQRGTSNILMAAMVCFAHLLCEGQRIDGGVSDDTRIDADHEAARLMGDRHHDHRDPPTLKCQLWRPGRGAVPLLPRCAVPSTGPSLLLHRSGPISRSRCQAGIPK